MNRYTEETLVAIFPHNHIWENDTRKYIPQKSERGSSTLNGASRIQYFVTDEVMTTSLAPRGSTGAGNLRGASAIRWALRDMFDDQSPNGMQSYLSHNILCGLRCHWKTT